MPSRRPGCRTSRARRPAAPRTAPSPRQCPGTPPTRWCRDSRSPSHPGLAELQVVAGNALVEHGRLLGPHPEPVPPAQRPPGPAGPGEGPRPAACSTASRSWTRSPAWRRPSAAAARCRSARRPAGRSAASCCSCSQARYASAPVDVRRSRRAARPPRRVPAPGRTRSASAASSSSIRCSSAQAHSVRLHRVEVGAQHRAGGRRRAAPARPRPPRPPAVRTRSRSQRATSAYAACAAAAAAASSPARGPSPYARTTASWVGAGRVPVGLRRPTRPPAGGPRGRPRSSPSARLRRQLVQHRRHRGQPGQHRLRVVRAAGDQLHAVPHGRQRAERGAQQPQRLAGVVPVQLRLQPPAQERRGRLVGGRLPRQRAQLGERAAHQVGPGVVPVRAVVGAGAGRTGHPAHGRPHRVQGRQLGHVPVAEIEDRARHDPETSRAPAGPRPRPPPRRRGSPAPRHRACRCTRCPARCRAG